MNHVDAIAAQHAAAVPSHRSNSAFGSVAFYLFGMLLMSALSSLAVYNDLTSLFGNWNMIAFTIMTCASYLVIWFFLNRFSRYPNRNWMETTFVIVSSVFLGLVSVLILTRLNYSRTYLITSYAFSLSWFMYATLIVVSRKRKIFTLMPFEGHEELRQLPMEHISFEMASDPEEPIDTDGVVLDVNRALPEDWARTLVDCQVRGIPIIHYVSLYETTTGKVPLEAVNTGVLGNFPDHPFYPFLKRLIDVGIVLVTLPVWGLLLMTSALIIKLRYKGPVFFTQDRVGRMGRVFRIIKLRTMYHRPEDTRAQFASRNDPRITPFGKFLRKYRIDELPQFWNVIRGEMSLIGPRPEQVPFVREFEKQSPFYGYRHLVRPGITGWAQVTQGYSAGEKQAMEKLQFDLYYIKHSSLTIDLLIIFRTIQTILTGFGSR